MARRARSSVTSTPSASGLTGKEAKLVALVIEAAAEGKRFPTREELGTQAGYGIGETARVQASRALRRPHVRDAIREGLHQNAGVDAARAYSTLRIAAEDAPSARDRITAASKIMDMAGIGSGPPMGQGPVIQFIFRHAGERLSELANPPWLATASAEERQEYQRRVQIIHEPSDAQGEPCPAIIEHQPEEAA